MNNGCWLVALVVLFSCTAKQEAYLNHKLVKAEKLAEDCNAYNGAFKMESTIIGERYQFQKCLHTTYDGKYTAKRKGDTVELRLSVVEGPQALYNITVDIDAYPRYHFLTIDGTTFAIVPTQN